MVSDRSPLPLPVFLHAITNGADHVGPVDRENVMNSYFARIVEMRKGAQTTRQIPVLACCSKNEVRWPQSFLSMLASFVSSRLMLTATATSPLVFSSTDLAMSCLRLMDTIASG